MDEVHLLDELPPWPAAGYTQIQIDQCMVYWRVEVVLLVILSAGLGLRGIICGATWAESRRVS